MPVTVDEMPERMASKIEVTHGCWFWMAACGPDGYGRFWFNGRTSPAHRAIYEFFHGPVPEGLDLDHLCQIRYCVNPAHLEPVTRSVNNRRGFRRTPSTHCKRGHEFTPENTYEWHGHRHCRECGKAIQQRQDIKRKEARRLARANN